MRVAGLCDQVAPPRRILDGGKEILCHHTGAELEAAQVTKVSESSRRQRA
jgi:peptide/nickel transport system ATP-binding protein